MKRVLLVYHSFDGWEMGPIRMRRIARHLARFGYQPVVLTSHVTCQSTAEAPPGVELIRVRALDLAELYSRLRGAPPVSAGKKGQINRNIRLTSAINRWVMIPDKQITWLRPAIAEASRYLRAKPVDLIFGSLAPRTNLLVATRLARKFRVPCVVEFRDLWTNSYYRHLDQPTILHRWLHSRLERVAIRDADRVTVVAKGLAERLQAQYADVLRHPIALNYNFYDESEFEGTPPRCRGPDDPFVLSYVGNIYDRRNPYVFFEGLRRFLDRHNVAPQRFRFRWAGATFAVPGIEAAIQSLGLSPYIDFLGQKTHAEALRILRESDFSLLIQAPGDTIHIPGKLFESIGARVPILALSDPCETAEIIERTNSGIISAHEASSVETALSRAYHHVRSGSAWIFNEPECAKYSADSVVANLARLFEEAISTCRFRN